MYQIFYRDKPIVISDTKSDKKNVHNIEYKDFNLKKALKNLSKNSISSVRIIGKDKEKINVKTLSNYSTLLRIAQKTQYISEIECKMLEKWNGSPSSWS